MRKEKKKKEKKRKGKKRKEKKEKKFTFNHMLLNSFIRKIMKRSNQSDNSLN